MSHSLVKIEKTSTLAQSLNIYFTMSMQLPFFLLLKQKKKSFSKDGLHRLKLLLFVSLKFF